MNAEEAITHIIHEFNNATSRYGSFRGRHEGYGVLKEEVDELWDVVKTNGPTHNLQHEAIQVAAMAFRFLVDCT